MEESAFEQQKAGLITRLLEKDKNLAQRSQRYWRNMAEENYRFDSNQQIAERVGNLSKPDMLAFLRTVLQRVTDQRLLIYSDGAFGGEDADSKELASNLN
jgi:secreted Zn-dependent insulinase-like peptidase